MHFIYLVFDLWDRDMTVILLFDTAKAIFISKEKMKAQHDYYPIFSIDDSLLFLSCASV